MNQKIGFYISSVLLALVVISSTLFWSISVNSASCTPLVKFKM